MAGYQRFVYYIYSYENGEKRTNVGFLRIEVRNGICKMTIQIRALSQTQPLKIYLFKRGRQRLNCYEAGSLPIQAGVGNTTLSYTMDELADASLSLTELGGMILFSSREKFYATTWDDDGIIIDEMVVVNQENTSIPTQNQEPVEEAEAQTPDMTQNQDVPQNGSTNQRADVPQNGSTNQRPDVPQEAGTNQRPDMPQEAGTNQRQDVPQETGTNQRPDVPPQTGSVKQEIQVQCLAEEPSLEYASKLLSTYPKMYPFEGDSVLDCVRIELQDIHELPIEYWSLAHNSFLMQGYYSYLHLIFALIKNKDAQNSYIIGIPGICHARQHYLAGLFGFQRFMPIRITNDINGEFGYWVCELSKINA